MVIRHDLSAEYAQLSVFPSNASTGELWITSGRFELRIVLSLAQVALLAHDAVGMALGPVSLADTEQCWKPNLADRSPQPLDAAYDQVITAARLYVAHLESATN